MNLLNECTKGVFNNIDNDNNNTKKSTISNPVSTCNDPTFNITLLYISINFYLVNVYVQTIYVLRVQLLKYNFLYKMVY